MASGPKEQWNLLSWEIPRQAPQNSAHTFLHHPDSSRAWWTSWPLEYHFLYQISWLFNQNYFKKLILIIEGHLVFHLYGGNFWFPWGNIWNCSMGLASLQIKQQKPILFTFLFCTRESRIELGRRTLDIERSEIFVSKCLILHFFFLRSWRKEKSHICVPAWIMGDKAHALYPFNVQTSRAVRASKYIKIYIE